MSVFTLAKGSSATCAATEDKTLLCNLLPSRSSKLIAFSLRAGGTSPPRRRPRVPPVFTVDASWRKDRPAECLEMLASTMLFGFAAPARTSEVTIFLVGTVPEALRSKNSARSLTSSMLEMLFFSSARAPDSACNSSARICVRWSQSLALASQRSVRSFRYNWSSLRTVSAFTKSSRALAISPFNPSISPSKSSMASPFVWSWPARVVLVESQLPLVFSHSESKSVLSPSKSVFREDKVSMIPCDLNLYSGSAGSTCVWRSASMALRFGSATRFSTSASIRPCCMDSRTDSRAAVAGLEDFKALIAFSRDPIAFVRSAALAS
mmetsp:Transcript_18619/g.46750  ORF Transcript_18619/g.46750 Transcript_18619/m.46750 type:complete len:322 (-) Transcript_18619:478-1443(-)